MTDDDEFDHIVKNSQRVLRLNDQYENHPYVEEFTKECNVMFSYGTYVLEGKAVPKFSLGDIWNSFQGDCTKQRKQFLQANDKLYEIVELPTKYILEIIRQVHRLMMEDKKDVLTEEYRESPAVACYHIFAPASCIERYMEDAIFKFYETKKDNPIMAAPNLFGNIINIHPFEDGNGRICRLILAHVLIQMKCCLFPLILSSFYRSGRRHYIRAVKMFDRNPLMLYNIIVKSFIHCSDNFEQNAKTTLNFKYTHYWSTLAYRSTWPRRDLNFNKDGS